MEKFNYKNHTVLVIEGYYGKQMFINDAEGNQIYAHRFSGDARERAEMILGAEEVKVAAAVATVAASATQTPNTVHITNDGRKINIVDLTDDHLSAILPKVRYSNRRFLYIQEAKKRGIYTPSQTPAQIYQTRVNAILAQVAA